MRVLYLKAGLNSRVACKEAVEIANARTLLKVTIIRPSHTEAGGIVMRRTCRLFFGQ